MRSTKESTAGETTCQYQLRERWVFRRFRLSCCDNGTFRVKEIMMKTIRGLLGGLAWVTLLAGLTVIPAQTLGQEKVAKPEERDKLIAGAREIMIAARYCALITLDSNGQAQARTMDPFPPGDDMIVWLATNPKSRKVSEIGKNPRVVLYYFDQPTQSYVAISGTARLVDDAREKARHWKDEWKDFYPDRGKGYLLIAVTPEKLEVVSVKKGISGDASNWNPPTVNFKAPSPSP
jgi:general stress protein 26